MEKTNWRLGLDVGTNSIGWCAWNLKIEDNVLIPETMKDWGVRIFSNGRDPQHGDSLALARRLARGMRRQRDRKNRRKKRMLYALISLKLMPLEKTERDKLKFLDPYPLREKAIKEKLEAYELGRVLFHLCIRRGFQSNRKTDNQDKDISEFKSHINELGNLLKNKEITLGEFLAQRLKAYFENRKNKIQSTETVVRFRPGTQYYPDRSFYLEEYCKIKEKQSQFYPNINWDEIENIIFYQRPLKPVQKGKCCFYLEEPRAYAALPSFQRFRYLQLLADLRYKPDPYSEANLSPEEKKKLAEAFETKLKVTIDYLKKFLKASVINYEPRKDFPGNETSATMVKPENWGKEWLKLSLRQQDEIIQHFIEEEDSNEIQKYLKQFTNLSSDQINNLSHITFKDGTARYSQKALLQLVERMEDFNEDFYTAKCSLGFEKNQYEIAQKDSLPYYGEVLPESVMGGDIKKYSIELPEKYYGKINNPTVHIALNQIRKLINVLIAKYGKPCEIVIELSRDLPMGKIAKSKEEKKNNENKKKNDFIANEWRQIHKLPATVYPSAWDIKKGKLWWELNPADNLNRECVYCGKKISATDAYGAATEIDHILPYSKTLLDNMTNLILVHKECNQFKGNRTPFEAFCHSPSHYRWDDIIARADRLTPLKASRFKEDAMKEFEGENQFSARNLNDGRYIATVTRKYLSHICEVKKIWVITGNITSTMKRFWGLEKLHTSKNIIDDKDKKSKNRTDHRHHAIDAAVIGLVDRRTVQLFANANQIFDLQLKQSRFDNIMRYVAKYKEPFPFPHKPEEVLEKLRHLIPSIKPDHGLNGFLFKETAVGLSLCDSLIKIEKFDYKQHIDQVVSSRLQELLFEYHNNRVEKPLKDFLAENNYNDEEIALRDKKWTSRLSVSSIESENDIERIKSLYFKKLLQEEWKNANDDKNKFQERMLVWTKVHGVRRLRYIPKTQEYVIKEQSTMSKAYENGDFAFVEIWKIPDKKGDQFSYQGIFIPRWQALTIETSQLSSKKNQALFSNLKPTARAKFVCRLFKDDIISLEINGNRQLGIICGYAATKNKLDVYPIECASSSLKEWLYCTNEAIINTNWPMVDNQNHVSINVLFKDKKARKEIITIDGKLKRL